MADRAYTVQEIDDLRQVVENKLTYGRYAGLNQRPAEMSDGPNKQGYSTWLPAIEPRDIEERVRTHMLAGHVALDLVESEGATTWTRTMRCVIGVGQ